MTMTTSRKPLPALPQTQALSSTTFRPPPLDGSLTVPEIYDWHLEHTPNHRLFVYADDNGVVKNIKWPEAVRAIHTGTKIIRDRLNWTSGMDNTPVIAILAPSESISYWSLTMSIMRANYTAFPISPRNSATAVAHLLSKAGVKHMLVGREQSMVQLANDALEILGRKNSTTLVPQISAIPLFEDLFLPPSDGTIDIQDLPYECRGPDTTALILHSSGSTAFPKPIYWSHRHVSEITLSTWWGERDLTDKVVALHAIPMYHGMGIFQICWTASCGVVMSVFEPKYPAQVPTPESLFKGAKATNSDYIFCVPSLLEAWSRNPEYVKWLSGRGGALYGGGPLDKESGDYLNSQGVSIFNMYGSVEAGIISYCLPAETGCDWEYFRVQPLLKSHMMPYGDGTFELMILASGVQGPSVLNAKVDGIEAYSTSDLLIPHSSRRGYWKVFGRTDDQIMHNTGEKTNPGPLENILNQDPLVLASVMFGRGRFQAGVLVDPEPEFKFDPSDEAKLAEFRNKIWPTVERMNEYAPQHSRLFKEMIVIAKPSKPFTYTAKSTPRRHAIINEYEEEINALYEAIDESAQTSIPPPAEWDITGATDFVRAVVGKVLLHKVRDEDDLFQHGCDSLQATWIRNSLLRALRDSAKLDTRAEAVGNFVYDHPSIVRLASFVCALASGTSSDANASISSRANAMRAMVSKYARDFHTHPATSIGAPTLNGDVVLVTGTTGGLGSYLLARFVSAVGVSRVYALNRPAKDGKGLDERQKAALVDRGLDASMVDSKKLVLLGGDLSTPGFDLPGATFQEMQQSVTHIIHNAWRVDFNLALSSFESNVKGTRGLIDFALSSPLPEPPQLIFTSSVGVFHNIDIRELQPESPIAAESAVGNGYTESKWVSEQILLDAAAQTPLKSLIVRVGQLCGDENGAWNANEWFPSLIQSATLLKCLPDDKKEVSWIPLPIAAAAVDDFRKVEKGTNVVHLIHPRPVSWSSLAAIASSELSARLVSYSDWLAKLEKVAIPMSRSGDQRETQVEVDLMKRVRALRLLPFFKGIAATPQGNDGEAFGLPKLAVTRAVASSATLADGNLPQLDADHVKGWLGYWRRVGLFSVDGN